ncbi:aspartic proteinase CDR1-like [Vicia villosa]|uniref:aspartic proteinase CDR1-like n=1 Tax=Vicia villosa TaxID=3911 RepID=UPI00273C5A58|nr:aspartic proteinase CDR1-like [Vicia villosa]
MTTSSWSFLTFILFSLSCFIISLSDAANNGFSVELIHRDSPKSPFYQPSQNKYQRIANAMNRSINHVNFFNKASLTNYPISTVVPDKGEYLMIYSLGTPPTKLYGILDTGSDIVWLQCHPCIQCYNQTTHIFDPSKSLSYKDLLCSSKECKSVEFSSCSKNNSCEYSIDYVDGTISQGNIGVETLTLNSTSGSSFSFPNFVIGCGHKNTMPFQGRNSGVVGIGGGPISLLTQLNSSTDGKFSYCLGPSMSNSTSKFSFGDAAVVSGPGVVSTTLVKKSPPIFYFVSLNAFSVGNKIIGFSKPPVEGNFIIDSGATLTTLPSDIYKNVESTIVALVKLNRVDDPNKILSLCYSDKSNNYVFPKITAHFKGGDVWLDSISTFIPVADGVVCLAFAPSQDDIGVFGNLVQQNLLVGYDLQRNTVSFKPTDCTKL